MMMCGRPGQAALSYTMGQGLPDKNWEEMLQNYGQCLNMKFEYFGRKQAFKILQYLF